MSPYKNTRPAPENWDPAQPDWSLLSLTVAARKWLDTRPDVDIDAVLDGLRADGVLAQDTPRGATWLRTNTHDILVDMAAATVLSIYPGRRREPEKRGDAAAGRWQPAPGSAAVNHTDDGGDDTLELTDTVLADITEALRRGAVAYVDDRGRHIRLVDDFKVVLDDDGHDIVAVYARDPDRAELAERDRDQLTKPKQTSPTKYKNRQSTTPVRGPLPQNTDQLIEMLHDRGFTVTKGRKHQRVTHPCRDNEVYFIAATPSDHRSLKNTVADIRRIFDIDLRQI